MYKPLTRGMVCAGPLLPLPALLLPLPMRLLHKEVAFPPPCIESTMVRPEGLLRPIRGLEMCSDTAS